MQKPCRSPARHIENFYKSSTKKAHVLTSLPVDLPSIVSGETVAFLDPHEKYFVRGQPGQAFCMEEPLLTENYDQFEPFHEIFDCSLSQGNHFRGTLFRFPLRTEPSKLSSKVYTKSMVNALFESFQNEASVILHFLKNIDCIRLYERESRGALHHIYSVKVSDDSKAEVRRKRKELTANITPDWDFTAKSAFYTLEVEEHGEGKDCKKRKWFMANQVGTNEGQLIALGKELKLLPWIGMAFPIDSNHCGSHGGRIFCFLPLPPDADCRTGLPVHVNGYFGLTDNRRSLKWPGPDCQNDDTAEWNRLLLRKVGSCVYVSLIENMITNRSVPASELAAHAQLVYSAFPRLHDVKEDWQCLLQPFCTKILAKDIFFTAANRKAGWINLNQAVFNRLGQSGEPSKEVKEVVISSLLKACQPVVTLPGHVLEIVDVYSHESGWQTIKEISPSLVRDVLRESSERACLPVEAEKKLLLLEYVLQDTPENATDLQGVPLLPLENGEFCTFQLFKLQSSASKKVFIATQKHKVGLLPNAKHRLLRNSISLTLKQKLAQLPGINRSTGFPTQLFNLTRNDVPQLLWESFPPHWSRYHRPDQQTVSWTPEDQSHPPAGWLQLLWEWVADQYPSNPSQLEDMPLIPLSVGSCRSLGRLRRNSTIIVAKHWTFTDSLPVTVRQLLTASGCAVIDQLPSYLKHAHIFDYVTPPTPQGVLKVLTMVAKTVCSRLETSSDDVKLQLRSILSKMRSMSTDEVSFLQTLPIFRAIDGKHFIACRVNDQKRPVAPQNFSLPEGIQLLDQGEIISSSEEESIRLLKELRMEVQTTAGLLMTRLETYMKGTGYSKLEKNKLMLWILERMEILGEENPGFVPFLRRLSFVPTDSGTRKAPCQLFDHCDQVLSQMLLDYPDAFPSKEFSRPMQKRQSDLGVRCRNNLTALDLVEISSVRSSSSQNGLKKGNALLDVLNQRPNLLTESVLGGTSLSDKLREVVWLPRVVHRPDRYPKFLPWYDGDHVCKPKDMCPSSVALLVGASVPVFDDRHVKKEVQGKPVNTTNLNSPT